LTLLMIDGALGVDYLLIDLLKPRVVCRRVFGHGGFSSVFGGA
jgi:hypothetical protein